MRIIITGGAGFIGSAAVYRAIRDGHVVLNVDKLTYAGRAEAISGLSGSPQYHFLKADIADEKCMRAIFADFIPDAVLHFAAESHVDRSIDDPIDFVKTNVTGTFALLEAALQVHKRLGRLLFVHVSTDEVFGALQEAGSFKAESRYMPTSPYAATKAASDHLARAWHHTYSLPVIVTNCSNNYGPRQHPEKLVPTIISRALAGAPIPIYGAGQNIRDWIYVDDHVEGIFASLLRGHAGDTYLFGARCEMRNLDLARIICETLDQEVPSPTGGSYSQQIELVADRPGHDFRYAIDPSYAETALGWRAKESLNTGLYKTIDWYLKHPEWLNSYAIGRLGLRGAKAN
jgi:dTDP-glucose 4,6-dehydratase